jgi:hypothetical protein
MALNHIPVQPTSGKSVLFTVPKGAPQCQVTIQNRIATIDIAIGDTTIGTGANSGVKIAAGGQIQLLLNSEDTVYAYSGSAFSTEYVVVLYSYVSTWDGRR